MSLTTEDTEGTEVVTPETDAIADWYIGMALSTNPKDKLVPVTFCKKMERQRDEAIDCGQEGVCANPPGCQRHWEERNRELVCERDEARKMAHLWRRLYFLMWAGLVDQPVPPDGKPPFPWEDGK